MTRRRSKAKVNAKGRNANPQFIPVPYSMAQSEAFRSLKPVSVKVWLELRSRFNGFNNGEVHLSYRQAAKCLGVGRSSVQTAFYELEERGFIELMKIGHMMGRKATLWRITDQGCNGKQATNDWRNWKPGMCFRKTEIGPEMSHLDPLTVLSKER
ncbi:helix-turn-helix domain-containing protein [Sneathiella aquimaris]|uniref:helix-turn-helix domain-containing protein n=1 Tax=Sneathiella aquimaris TaxID=2599305 RepID=UPI001469E90B|nr:helix-turn-helix domain-containing protein [Sneathiella aquimaris]